MNGKRSPGGSSPLAPGDATAAGPTWIAPLLGAVSLLFCAAALAAVFGAPDGEYGRYAPAVADLIVNLNGTPVREHCTTCHPAGSRAAARGDPAGAAHPDLGPHDLDDLGCTGCHLGEGMALDIEASHGRIGNGSRRVLAGEELQASCYRCHELAPLRGAARAWNGYRLFRELACAACHHLTEGGHGGRYGPDLSRVGTYLSIEAIEVAVADPRREPETSSMPRFPLSETEVADLSYFLKSRVENPAHSTPMERRAEERRHGALVEPSPIEPVPSGEELVGARHCRACHRLGEEGNWIGPDLTHIGALRDADYLFAFPEDPTRWIPGARMPRIPMGSRARRAVAGFLAASDPGIPPGASAKRLYMALCQPCHAADGTGHGIVQPNLAQFPRAFRNNAAFFRRAADERLVRSVREGVPGTSMPPYGRLLSGAQVDAVLDLVFRAFVRIPRDEKALPLPLPSQPDTPLPRAAVDRAYERHCASCHGRAGNGKGPESARHLPRPRNLSNRPYFSALGDRRIAREVLDGVPGTAMKGFRQTLDPELVWGLVERVRRFAEPRDE